MQPREREKTRRARSERTHTAPVEAAPTRSPREAPPAKWGEFLRAREAELSAMRAAGGIHSELVPVFERAPRWPHYPHPWRIRVGDTPAKVREEMGDPDSETRRIDGKTTWIYRSEELVLLYAGKTLRELWSAVGLEPDAPTLWGTLGQWENSVAPLLPRDARRQKREWETEITAIMRELRSRLGPKAPGVLKWWGSYRRAGRRGLLDLLREARPDMARFDLDAMPWVGNDMPKWILHHGGPWSHLLDDPEVSELLDRLFALYVFARSHVREGRARLRRRKLARAVRVLVDRDKLRVPAAIDCVVYCARTEMGWKRSERHALADVRAAFAVLNREKKTLSSFRAGSARALPANAAMV